MNIIAFRTYTNAGILPYASIRYHMLELSPVSTQCTHGVAVCFAGKQSVFPSLASAKAHFADLGAGDLQAELRVTRRVDERSEWQPSAEI